MDTAALLAVLEPLAIMAMLALARAGGLIVALPHAASPAVPRQVRALLILALTLSLVGVATPPSLPRLDIIGLVLLMMGEVLVGLALGFVVQLALAGIRMAGELIGVEIGLSFSAVADPANPGASTATASLLGHLGVQLFFALGIDRALIGGLAHSMRMIPLGTGRLGGDTVATLSDQAGGALEVALHLALPVLATGLAVKLALAVLARFVPKLQVFGLAFAITLAAGLVALHRALPSLGEAVARHLWDAVAAFDRVIATLAS
jgi:flagellar biosynthetic protein FliR